MSYKVCKICGGSSKNISFKGNSSVCLSCVKNKTQQSHKNKSKLLEKEEYSQYLYKMLNDNNEIVYIGQTSDLDKRIKQHCVLVNEEIISRELKDKYMHTTIPYEHLSEIKKVLYSKVENKYISSMYEVHLIAKYMPVYNSEFKYYTPKLFELPELEWQKYTTYFDFKWEVMNLKNLSIKDLPNDLFKLAKNLDTRKQALDKLFELDLNC